MILLNGTWPAEPRDPGWNLLRWQIRCVRTKREYDAQASGPNRKFQGKSLVCGVRKIISVINRRILHEFSAVEQ